MLLNREQREQLRQMGRWLDGKLGTEPWLKWIGLGLGLAAGGVSLYRVVRRAQRVMEEEDESP
ncbi:MAG: AtpZ/AtpI family protein [Deltaproteobacteria bacterium]|nr:AtpZ/AtpI family protein [Deltaproteobacteria bacterium]